jgi:hypothetical protein
LQGEKVLYFNSELWYNGYIELINEGNTMIRVIFGLLVVLGAVGGMDNAPDSQLPLLLVIAAVGLVSMYFGSKSISE